jgi:hypothetical protein
MNRIIPGLATVVFEGGTPIQVSTTDLSHFGGFVANPPTATESLYISLIKVPLFPIVASVDISELRPGQGFIVPPGAPVWVNAVSSGHAFTSYFLTQPTQYPPSPVAGEALPLAPTGLVDVMYSYLYQQYSDDEDLQAFVAAQNAMQQNYVDTFNALNLPIYTNPLIAGPLLDWVAMGVYGYRRPIVYAGRARWVGSLNTWWPNYFVTINGMRRISPKKFIVVDDDFYKRCLTWHYFKGDGKYFDVRWLKRRIYRFCLGTNGSNPVIDTTQQVSVTFPAYNQCTIDFISSTTPLPYVNEFSEAVNAGALELPLQITFTVNNENTM